MQSVQIAINSNWWDSFRANNPSIGFARLSFVVMIIFRPQRVSLPTLFFSYRHQINQVSGEMTAITFSGMHVKVQVNGRVRVG